MGMAGLAAVLQQLLNG